MHTLHSSLHCIDVTCIWSFVHRFPIGDHIHVYESGLCPQKGIDKAEWKYDAFSLLC
jgi:hypothetical protein